MEPRSQSYRPPTLLLIDDCSEERDMYEFALEREFIILTASRGAEGVALATRKKPDAIVLDVMMPGLDGWETCTLIKTHAPTADIPVILLTGADDRDLSRHAMAVGATALVRKPCPVDRLREAIFTALGTSGHQRV